MKHKKLLSTAAAIAMLPTVAFANVNYTVQKGDSYWTVSQKFNTSLNSVLSANNATANSYLITGQVITIPSDTYTVQKGDTYYLIAKKCGVSLSSLLSANNATESSVLYVGNKIKIPSSKDGYTTYTVEKGDTYYLIAKKYGISLSTLLSANDATDGSVLYVGDTIKVPSSSQSPSGGTTSGPYITYSTHTVKSGDTLWNIAIK